MTTSTINQTTEALRRFNRFYTKQIGILTDHYLVTPFSLTEARVLYELARQEITTATELGKELGLDPGYLSRILRKFKKEGFIEKQPSDIDGRQTLLHLTEHGQATLSTLNARSQADIERMLGSLSAAEQHSLVQATEMIQQLLTSPALSSPPYLLRSHRPGDMGWIIHRPGDMGWIIHRHGDMGWIIHRPGDMGWIIHRHGDMGWIIHRHGVLYSQEYGWDERFEALVARVAAEFIEQFDPLRERCWIAERNGAIVGSVFLVKQSDTVAKLRLLYVEPEARGLGIGKRLVEECIRFARQTGYATITLWTQSILTSARYLYVQTGFRKVHEETNSRFGHDLISETWELAL